MSRRDIPKTDFDQDSAAFAADPWSKYDELRTRCPVAHTDAHGGFWVVSKYRDVVRVAKDDLTFSSVPTTVIPDSGVYNLIPLQSDPPDLQRYRAAWRTPGEGCLSSQVLLIGCGGGQPASHPVRRIFGQRTRYRVR